MSSKGYNPATAVLDYCWACLGVILRAYVDADHAADMVTRRSRKGFIVFLNSAPIYWFSKKQNSVETSLAFGSEFMAMNKHCTEYVSRGLQTQNDGNTV